ncbi:MAG: putative integrase/recombinase [Candidatus Rokubacteria bacterium]|nr:putative integrase/recombinase [Candidatus Rokubacteria bacterium]
MLEEHLPAFLVHLGDLRYHPATIALAGIESRRFLAYAETRVRRPEEIDRETAAAYLALLARRFRARRGRPMGAGRRARLHMALCHLLRYLAARGLCPRAAPLPRRRDPCAVPGYAGLLDEYRRFLIEHRGLARSTVEGYLDETARLCRACGPEAGAWDELSPVRLYDHLLARASGRSPRTLQIAYSAIRSFFRFLALIRRASRPLVKYLVRTRVSPRSYIPTRLSEEELYRVADAVRGDSPRLLLNRAVILLLIFYGLRVGEVARLALEDVRWRAGELWIRRRKGGRDLVLPLHAAVAEALAAYIARARPRGTPHREVFLCRVGPHPYLRGSNIARGITRQLRRHGIRLRLHSLRHTLASRLINADCPPAWIQILLGHVHPDSTRAYAKVDLAHLAEVTQNEVLDR